MIAAQPLKEIRARLKFLIDVGLGYLTLDRPAARCPAARRSGFAWPRRWAAGWSACCYVLDEPTIGLHRRDNDRLLGILKQLRDIGNTVLVVEHDEDVIRGGRLHHRHRPGGRGARRAGDRRGDATRKSASVRNR